jgi:hypothetical protein
MRVTLSFVPVVGIALAAILAAPAAHADESATAAREAGKHFQRAVQLYNEADYRAALVEFKRAYAGSPNVSVLYNIGETQYQLQDYASALTSLERYLAESGPTDSRRTEVESTVETLRARVGHVNVVTIPAGADVTLDDQPLGRTPIDRPTLVSIGHRKLTATMAGRLAVTKYVDVATDDNLFVTLQLQDPTPAAASKGPGTVSLTLPPDPPPPSHTGAAWRVVGWTTTAVLAASAITFGVLAENASNNLVSARNSYPVSASTLSQDANVTSTYSILADSFAIAALVIGGITLTSSIVSWSAGEPPKDHAARVVVGPGSARLDWTF